jgi:hypothetical protein
MFAAHMKHAIDHIRNVRSLEKRRDCKSLSHGGCNHRGANLAKGADANAALKPNMKKI